MGEIERVREDEVPSNRCVVCKQDYQIRSAIDKMFAMGESINSVFAVLNDWPVASFKNSKVPSAQSLRGHEKNHLAFKQNAYRRILEKRAAEQGVEIEENASSYLTNIGMVEVIARQGFTDIMEGKTKVTTKETLEAIKLAEQFEQDTSNAFDAVEAMAQVHKILYAVNLFTTAEQQEQIADYIKNGQIDDIVLDEGDSWYNEEE